MEWFNQSSSNRRENYADARDLAKRIPDESIDLIFTDPVYQNIDDYRWLEETSTRILKPDGNALAFVNAKWWPFVFDVAPTKLPPLVCVQTSGPSPMNGRVIAKSYYLLWWGSGQLVGYMPDGYVGTVWSKAYSHNHKWTKNPKYLKTTLLAFTIDNAVILDPFTGGGSIPVVCKMLSRNHIAFEIDPETAELARERVLNTQPPLFVMEPEQLELLDE